MVSVSRVINLVLSMLVVATFLFIPNSAVALEGYFEVKPGYYQLNDKVLKKIFKDGGFTWALEGGVMFNECFSASLNVSFFRRSGKTYNDGGLPNHRTDMQLVGTSLLFKAYMPCYRYFKPYAGIGPKWFNFKSRNHAPDVKHLAVKNQIGGVATVGVLCFLCDTNFYLDPFVEYNFAKLKFPSSINLYDLTYGVGVGCMF